MELYRGLWNFSKNVDTVDIGAPSSSAPPQHGSDNEGAAPSSAERHCSGRSPTPPQPQPLGRREDDPFLPSPAVARAPLPSQPRVTADEADAAGDAADGDGDGEDAIVITLDACDDEESSNIQPVNSSDSEQESVHLGHLSDGESDHEGADDDAQPRLEPLPLAHTFLELEDSTIIQVGTRFQSAELLKATLSRFAALHNFTTSTLRSRYRGPDHKLYSFCISCSL